MKKTLAEEILAYEQRALCRYGCERIMNDPHYSVTTNREWRTYLMREKRMGVLMHRLLGY